MKSWTILLKNVREYKIMKRKGKILTQIHSFLPKVVKLAKTKSELNSPQLFQLQNTFGVNHILIFK